MTTALRGAPRPRPAGTHRHHARRVPRAAPKAAFVSLMSRPADITLAEVPFRQRIEGCRRAVERGLDPYTGLALAIDPDRRTEPLTALARLTDKQREVFVDRVLVGRSEAEIARELGVTHAAVHQRYASAVRNLERRAA